MPHFSFDIDDGQRASSESDDCTDANAARDEAIRTLTEVVSNALPGGPHRDFSVKVWDDMGAPVFEAVLAFRSGWIGGHG